MHTALAGAAAAAGAALPVNFTPWAFPGKLLKQNWNKKSSKINK